MPMIPLSGMDSSCLLPPYFLALNLLIPTMLRPLPAAPEWYQNAKEATYFAQEDLPASGPESEFGKRNITYTAPDRSVEIVIREVAADEDDQINGPGHGKHYLLRELPSGRQ